MNRNTIAAIDEFIKTFLRNVHARDPAARAALDERLRAGAGVAGRDSQARPEVLRVNALDWLRRVAGRNPFLRRRLAERVLRRLGVSKTRAVALVRRIP